jgi:antitoxin (DNA-binding transcriptional repressor) of toxin-antitoxin stability system
VPEAKSHFSKLLKRVQLGEEIIIARGRPTHSAPSPFQSDARRAQTWQCQGNSLARRLFRRAPPAGDPKGVRVKVLLDTHAFSDHN